MHFFLLLTIPSITVSSMTVIYFSWREVPQPALSLQPQAVQPRRRQRSHDLSAVSNGMAGRRGRPVQNQAKKRCCEVATRLLDFSSLHSLCHSSTFPQIESSTVNLGGNLSNISLAANGKNVDHLRAYFAAFNITWTSYRVILVV